MCFVLFTWCFKIDLFCINYGIMKIILKVKQNKWIYTTKQNEYQVEMGIAKGEGYWGSGKTDEGGQNVPTSSYKISCWDVM